MLVQNQPTPLVDTTLEKIAKQLMDELNAAYPKQKVVQSYRTYDAYNVPTSDYPLLKVYRVMDTFGAETTKRTSRAVISYSLVLPDQEHLAPIMSWVSFQINKALLGSTFRFCVFHEKAGNTAEYRIMLNEVGNPVYSFLRFNITIKD